MISSAIISISRLATLAANTGSCSSGLPFFCCSLREALQEQQLALGAADRGDAGALVAQQILRIGPAAVLLADQVLHRHPTLSKKTSLTSWSSSSMMIGRTVMPGVFMSISRKEMPSCLRAAVGAHQAEDHVGMLAQRGPGLLAVDDVVVALALGAGASATPGRSPRPARNSPGTTSPRRPGCAADNGASAPRCRRP